MKMTIKKTGNLYQIDDNEIPIDSTTLRETLTSLLQTDDVKVSKIMDDIDEKEETSLEVQGNKGVVVDLYEVDYQVSDPMKETQNLAKSLDEKRDFVTQYLFPDSTTEDVLVGLRQDILKGQDQSQPTRGPREQKPTRLSWQEQPEPVNTFYKNLLVDIFNEFDSAMREEVCEAISQRIYGTPYNTTLPDNTEDFSEMQAKVGIDYILECDSIQDEDITIAKAKIRYRIRSKKEGSFKLAFVKELPEEEKQFILSTQKISSDLLSNFLNLRSDNWIRLKAKSNKSNIEALIGADTFRYLVALQKERDVEHYSIDYTSLVKLGVNPLDLLDVVEACQLESPDKVDEDTTLDQLINACQEPVIQIYGRKVKRSG